MTSTKRQAAQSQEKSVPLRAELAAISEHKQHLASGFSSIEGYR